MHTRWIETEWNNTVEPFTGGGEIDADEDQPRQTVVVEVGGRRLEVSLPGGLALGNGGGSADAGVTARSPSRASAGRMPVPPPPVMR